MHRRALLGASLLAPTVIRAQALDRVRIALFNVTSVLPYYTAIERGIFAKHGIECVTQTLQTPVLIVQAMVSGEADGTSNLVTLEAANINARRPGSAVFFSMVGQNSENVMEQFVVRTNSTARTVADLKGARIACAPGPANMAAARGVLAAAGLAPADYTLTEQPMGVHVGAVQAGQFDAAYTLEPVGTVGERAGVWRRLETGVIAKYILGRPEGKAFAAGTGFTQRFLDQKPDVARRFALAWEEAIALIRTDPTTRQYLTSHINVPAPLAEHVPLLAYVMVKNFTASDRQDMQRFVDFAVRQGVVRQNIDIESFIRDL
ncbi:ABC transporter substrate-binding protein [Rhodovarius lipocyclicus]|uniref:ABC transporter substrate-binding protein n=1 Tax=Rhodovarius lipocyclicus TaxID=268410 RepID=UPI0013570C32|nr:ABC transporter substrate-binding protein [Rhodovarius lipocyclicus]